MNTTTSTHSAAPIIAANWSLGLVAVLAVIYAALGFAAGWIGLLGIGGAIAVVVSVLVAARSRTTASLVLVAGAVPFAVATWSSIVVPFTALLLLFIGLPQIARLAERPSLASARARERSQR